MGRNYNRRKRAARAEAAELPEPPKLLWERRMEERAVRDGWLQDGADRARVIHRVLGDFEDDETDVRYRVAIGKTLIYADLGQQRLDFQKSRAAEAQYTAARSAEGAVSGTGSAEPIDPEAYEW